VQAELRHDTRHRRQPKRQVSVSQRQFTQVLSLHPPPPRPRLKLALPPMNRKTEANGPLILLILYYSPHTLSAIKIDNLSTKNSNWHLTLQKVKKMRLRLGQP
jgi:hypothetical protein